MANSATHKPQHFSRNFPPRRSGGTGQIAVFTLLLTGVVVVFMVILTGTLLSDAVTVGHAADQSLSQQLAESGIDRALWCMNHPLDCPANYTGETQTQGRGTFTVTAVASGNTGTLESTGKVNGSTVTVRTNVQNTSSANASFYYGVQSGTGGIQFNSNAKIVGANNTPGNVYVDGSVSIAGGNGTGTEITGDAVLAQSNPTTDAQADPPSPYTTFGVQGTSSTRYVAQSFVPSSTDKLTQISLKIARTSSAPSNPTLSLYYDNGNNKPGTMIPGAQITITSTSLPINTGSGWMTGFTDFLFTPNTMLTAGVRYWAVLQVSGANGSKFFTMVQTTTDLYASGAVMTGSDLASNLQQVCSPTSCDLAFKIGMGGVKPTLEIEKVGGVARSYYMKKARVTGKAYYRQLTEEHSVYANNGTDECVSDENGPDCYDLDASGGSDPDPQQFPISDAQIGVWEEIANNGGVVDCAVTPLLCAITSGSIGPKKYLGNVTIDNTVTLTGTVWVQGNLTMNNSALLKLSDAYGSDSGVIIADDQTSDLTKVQSGKIITNPDSAFLRNATAGTYIIGVAMSASQDTLSPAFSIGNNFSRISQNPLASALVYAPKGMVHIGQNGELKEVTAQTLYLENNAVVSYETGLSSIIFSSGPGGAWKPLPHTWQQFRTGVAPGNTGITNNTNAANVPPVLNPIGDKSTTTTSPLTFTVSGSDPENDPLTYSATNLPLGATFANQVFTWTPAANQIGTYPNVSFSVSDGIHSDSEAITISVTSADQTPPTPPTSIIFTGGTSYNIIDLGWSGMTDADGTQDIVQYTIYRCTGSSCTTTTPYTTTTSASYHQINLAGNTVYGYAIVALDAAGNASTPSSWFYVQTGSKYSPDPIPLARALPDLGNPMQRISAFWTARHSHNTGRSRLPIRATVS